MIVDSFTEENNSLMLHRHELKPDEYIFIMNSVFGCYIKIHQFCVNHLASGINAQASSFTRAQKRGNWIRLLNKNVVEVF